VLGQHGSLGAHTTAGVAKFEKYQIHYGLLALLALKAQQSAWGDTIELEKSEKSSLLHRGSRG